MQESKSCALPLGDNPTLQVMLFITKVGNGARTHDTWNHNPVLLPTELYPPKILFRARDGTRTRDPLLGKEMLYQLSHSRILTSPYQHRFMYIIYRISLHMSTIFIYFFITFSFYNYSFTNPLDIHRIYHYKFNELC